jgi:hypothetical protein
MLLLWLKPYFVFQNRNCTVVPGVCCLSHVHLIGRRYRQCFTTDFLCGCVLSRKYGNYLDFSAVLQLTWIFESTFRHSKCVIVFVRFKGLVSVWPVRSVVELTDGPTLCAWAGKGRVFVLFHLHVWYCYHLTDLLIAFFLTVLLTKNWQMFYIRTSQN